MERLYYFIATALPELQIGYPPDISFERFELLMKINLYPIDFKQIEDIQRYYDIENIRAFWKGELFDFRGNYNENDLEEALVTRMGLPEYIYEFMERYESKEERLKYFPQLVSTYFSVESENASGFLKEYLNFERDMRLVMTGFRAKKLGLDLAEQLQFEDPNDDIVAQILAQKDAKTYESPTDYADLKGLFEEHFNEPLELHQALCEYRFQKVEGLYGVNVFSMDRILAYLVQLIIVEKWLELDKIKGLEVVDKIIKEAV